MFTGTLKLVYLIFFIFIQFTLSAQDIQLHYDIRHTLDPEINPRNYPSLSFQYFKDIDSLGSFLFKMQSDLKGENNNIGQSFLQFSQTAKFWEPKIYLSVNYSGGLGIADPAYGYYIKNAFGLGVSVPFEWKNTWLGLNMQYRYGVSENPSHDAQITMYFWKGFFNYKMSLSGSIVSWTEDKNQETENKVSIANKKFAFFGDPQVWYKITGGFSLGSRINLYYNLFGDEPTLKVYPTLGVKYNF